MGPLRRAFGVGRVLGRSFPVLWRNIIRFTFLSALIHSPLIVHAALRLPEVESGRELRELVLLQRFAQFALGPVVAAAVIHGVFEEFRGKRATVLACLRVCLLWLFPVLLVSLLRVLAAFAVLLPAALIVGILAGAAGHPLALVLFAGALVPAAIVWCMYWVAVPAAVVERPGIVASLRRSAELTRGERASIFAIALPLYVLRAGAGFLVGLFGAPSAATYVAAALGIAILFGALDGVASAVAYHDLRVAKEGVGAEELARVFA